MLRGTSLWWTHRGAVALLDVIAVSPWSGTGSVIQWQWWPVGLPFPRRQRRVGRVPRDRPAGHTRADRNSARLVLAADLPASDLADVTATSISNATRWTEYAGGDWFDYVAPASRTHLRSASSPGIPNAD
ncbi:hypothetical protein GCM10010271_03670 [Streptomyces kurssanovii]|nr:hypothetical protein GCM10010271_03670 [Streptomyces kurssanovii]